MKTTISIPEPISTNIFDTYYQLIDRTRSRILDKSTMHRYDEQFLQAYNSFQTIIEAIEQNAQDIAVDAALTEHNDKLFESIVELLDSWLLYFASIEYGISYIKMLSDHYFIVGSILENIQEIEPIDGIRYLKKLTANVSEFSVIQSIEDTQIINELAEKYSYDLRDYPSLYVLEQEVSERKLEGKLQPKNYTSMVDVFDLPEIFRGNIIRDFSDSLYTLEDIHTVADHDLTNLDVKQVRSLMKRNFPSENLERMFQFNDETYDAVWDVFIIVKDSIYNAANIAFLIWSFSHALETIEDIEVELEKVGEGSKWFNLKVRVKALGSKVDLLQIFKTLRQGLESVYHRKPLDEIQKFEAEKQKLLSEADKISREASNLPTEEEATLQRQINLQNSLLQIQEKEIDIENKKADLRLKNLAFVKGISDLMREGILKNDSDMQIFINNELFFKKEEQHVTMGNESLIDVKEKIELRDQGTESITDINFTE